ncbi:hypothetical protein K1719_012334 [Acacia pycnantha]|nr:hypothetical protein K1719_012334 [Acacia pycnantha]
MGTTFQQGKMHPWCSRKCLVRAIAKTEGVIEALVKMIREPIGPNATKASLTKIFQLRSVPKFFLIASVLFAQFDGKTQCFPTSLASYSLPSERLVLFLVFP